MPQSLHHDIVKDEQNLFAVLSSDRFLRMEGLGNEVAHFIFDYEPDTELDVAQMRRRIKSRLATEKGISVLEINLYELCVDLLKKRGVWDRVLAREPDMEKPDFHRLLQNMLDPQAHLAPAIRERISAEQFEAWRRTRLVIDAVPGRGSGFSLETPTGRRFLTRSELCAV